MVAVPKYASTVILLRNHTKEKNESSFEVLMIKRSENMKFVGGYHAFPGGKIEEKDLEEKNLKMSKGLAMDQAYNILFDDKTVFKEKNIALGFWIAAIRELFEEIGILFVYQNDKLIEIYSDQTMEKFQNYRDKLIKKEISMFEIMEKEGLLYATDQLYYFRHFITPPISPIRFDARFFIAKLPEGQNQQIKPYSVEIMEFEWLTPEESLKKYKKGEIKIIPPQYACLKDLMNKNNIQKMIGDCFKPDRKC